MLQSQYQHADAEPYLHFGDEGWREFLFKQLGPVLQAVGGGATQRAQAPSGRTSPCRRGSRAS